MNLDPASKFARYEFPQETIISEHASPMVLAYIQNKICDYASALVEKQLPYNADPTAQVAAILAHERLRNFVEAYEELFSELTNPN